MTNRPEHHPDTPMASDAARIGSPLTEQHRIAELESKIGSLEQELSAVYSSRSWKITHPLRSVALATSGWIRYARAFLGGAEERRPTAHTDAASPYARVVAPAEASPPGELAPPPSANRTAQSGLAFCPPTEEKHLSKKAWKIYQKLKDALSKTCE